jgi:hypothetical protein
MNKNAWRLGIAGFVAIGMLAGASIADARTTRIQIVSRTTAFGAIRFLGSGNMK